MVKAILKLSLKVHLSKTYLQKLMVLMVSLAVTVVSSHAEEVSVAVAANFAEPAREISKIFTQQTGHEIVLSFGSSGSLYNQICQGAPFDVFLAADRSYPAKLIIENYGVPGTEFIYAIGKLVLWSANSGLMIKDLLLQNKNAGYIAYANPHIAPYGVAALEVLRTLGLYHQVKLQLVEGQNIAQTFQFVKTGNAEMGFIALSQLIREKTGSYWEIPQHYYQPIEQSALLLMRGTGNRAAKEFLHFLKSSQAKSILQLYGYQ